MINRKNYIYKLIYLLKSEKENKIRNGVYGFSQRLLAYNSNKIEGSTLTEKQTQYLFDTGTYLAKDGVNDVVVAKDVEEMNGHFKMFNAVLKTYDETLSHELIKSYHFQLKSGVFFDYMNGYAIGDYKKRYNMVGDIETAKPSEVHYKIDNLLNWYNSLSSVGIKELAILHSEFEKIHPFQDGNGRVGRIILFKECIKNNIVPFVIQDKNKALYYDVLNNAQKNKDYRGLIQLFEDEEENFFKNTVYFIFDEEEINGLDIVVEEIDEEINDMNNFDEDLSYSIDDDFSI